jgi:hypothetical protein
MAPASARGLPLFLFAQQLLDRSHQHALRPAPRAHRLEPAFANAVIHSAPGHPQQRRGLFDEHASHHAASFRTRDAIAPLSMEFGDVSPRLRVAGTRARLHGKTRPGG